MNVSIPDEIAKTAYNLYVKSGFIGGREMENWLEAERIVKALYADLGMLQGSTRSQRTGGSDQTGHAAETRIPEPLNPAGRRKLKKG